MASCGKERTIHIKAIHAATGQPYAGLEYRIASSRITADGEKYNTEASGTLDANGEAIEHIKQRKGRTYSVRVVEPTNTCYNKLITQYFDSQYDDNGRFTFEFAPCAYLKLNINNINCQSPNDDFKFYYMGRQVEGQGPNVIGALSLQGSGCYTDIGSDFSAVPMGKMYWKWVVTRNNISSTFYDTINLSANEYKTFNIEY